MRRSVCTLAVAGVAVAAMSDLLVGSIENTARDVGLSQFFIGAFVVAVVGNAAEHYVAVNGYELAALVSVALIVPILVSDGESTWFEGFQLISIYLVLGIVFYFA